MRTALGAPRYLLLRQLLTENVVLALAGAAAGMALAWLDLHVCLMYMPPTVARWVAGWYTIHLNMRALIFSVLLAVGAGIISGFAPALETMRVNLVDQLKSGSRTETGGGRSHRLRNFFAAAQIALAVALVIGSALMCKGMWSTLQFANVYHPKQVLTFGVTLPAARYGDAVKKQAWYKSSLDQMQTLPGVKRAAATAMLPYGDGGWTDDFRIENRPQAPGKFDSAVRVAISPGYFAAFHVGIVQGRGFTDGDGLNTDPVVVVSRKFAQRYFPGEDPIGHRIQMNAASNSHEPWMRIVGISEDAAYQWVEQTPQPAMYTDVPQFPPDSTQFVVTTDGSPKALGPEIRKAMAAIDPTLPLDTMQTYAEDIRDQTTGLMYATAMLALDAAIALLLAAIGIYGVMANLVAERRREIGVRLAMGARPEDVLRMILRRAAVLTGIGTVVGVAMAVLLARGVASLLFGVKPNDPTVFGSIIVSVAGIALLSSWLPARRAAAVDPMEALRDE